MFFVLNLSQSLGYRFFPWAKHCLFSTNRYFVGSVLQFKYQPSRTFWQSHNREVWLRSKWIRSTWQGSCWIILSQYCVFTWTAREKSSKISQKYGDCFITESLYLLFLSHSVCLFTAVVAKDFKLNRAVKLASVYVKKNYFLKSKVICSRIPKEGSRKWWKKTCKAH